MLAVSTFSSTVASSPAFQPIGTGDVIDAIRRLPDKYCASAVPVILTRPTIGRRLPVLSRRNCSTESLLSRRLSASIKSIIGLRHDANQAARPRFFERAGLLPNRLQLVRRVARQLIGYLKRHRLLTEDNQHIDVGITRKLLYSGVLSDFLMAINFEDMAVLALHSLFCHRLGHDGRRVILT
jgi:hypothetical protein